MDRWLTFWSIIILLSCQSEQNNTGNISPGNLSQSTSNSNETQIEFDTLLDSEAYLVLGSEPSEIIILKENEVDRYPTFNILDKYRNEVILGKNNKQTQFKIFKKYQPTSTFEEFSTKVYSGNLAAPDFESAPDAKRFHTRIEEECSKGINFAGHFTLVIWGCGSSCQSGVVVDRITGKIYDGYSTSLGAEFRKDSRLLIANVGAINPATKMIELCPYCEVSHEVWTGTRFKEIE
ncbi:MAG: hypothetical protein KDC24_08980 [Saprospiraceae bacterium]|nr:hypothetical protein [Saprospiraceae bacterium]